MNLNVLLATFALLPAGALLGFGGADGPDDGASTSNAASSPEAEHPDPRFRVERLEGTDVLTEVKTDRAIFEDRSDTLDRYEGSGLTFATMPGAVRFVATLTWDEVRSTNVQGLDLVLYREDGQGGFQPTGHAATAGGSPLVIDLGYVDVPAPGLYMLRARADQDPLVADLAAKQDVHYVVEVTYRFAEGESS